MENIVVVGGGWAGCSAALVAARRGIPVLLLERTDRLLASGLVGGIMRNNGRFTAAEELKLMGAGELIELVDALSRHQDLNFPGHRHASLYDVERVEQAVYELLREAGVEIRFQKRVVGVERKGRRISAVRAGEESFAGSAFVDATGTAGPMSSCRRNGNGCVMCVYRCPTFGPRASVAVEAGIPENTVFRSDGNPGYFSGSCELDPGSLEPRLLEEIRCQGVKIIPLPREWRRELDVKMKACRQYLFPEYQENLILLDTGMIKAMVPYFPLEKLRQIRGLERAVFRDPLAGGVGNSIRCGSLVCREDTLQVPPLENLFVAGERAGLLIGHTEAIATGALAGYNAWLWCRGRPPVALPCSTLLGTMVNFTGRMARSAAGRQELYNLAGEPSGSTCSN